MTNGRRVCQTKEDKSHLVAVFIILTTHLFPSFGYKCSIIKWELFYFVSFNYLQLDYTLSAL